MESSHRLSLFLGCGKAPHHNRDGYYLLEDNVLILSSPTVTVQYYITPLFRGCIKVISRSPPNTCTHHRDGRPGGNTSFGIIRDVEH